MTILTQKIGSGPTRVCNATCHNARTTKCKCICGGRYHGAKGLAPAMLARDWLGKDWDAARTHTALQNGTLTIPSLIEDAVRQKKLPFEEPTRGDHA